RNQGGTDDISNLQALCYSCNAMKRDRDATDFRAIRAVYEHRQPDCPFCSTTAAIVLLENNLAIVLKDKYPVSAGHVLIVPKRHTPDYFDLGTAELRACQTLLGEARLVLLQQDRSILGFNIGVNSGSTAGQTVLHTHIHLIPRRIGDTANP